MMDSPSLMNNSFLEILSLISRHHKISILTAFVTRASPFLEAERASLKVSSSANLKLHLAEI